MHRRLCNCESFMFAALETCRSISTVQICWDRK